MLMTDTEKGKVSYVLRGWRKAINNINKKYSKPRLKMTPLVKVFTPCSQTLSNNVGGYIKL